MPIEKVTRGAGYYTKATFLAVPDLVGNVVIGAIETTMTTGAVIVVELLRGTCEAHDEKMANENRFRFLRESAVFRRGVLKMPFQKNDPGK